jgi:hypothetical protein
MQSHFVWKGEVATNTYREIRKAFDNDSLTCAQVFQWHKDFVNEWEMVEDEPWSELHACLPPSRNAIYFLEFLDHLKKRVM